MCGFVIKILNYKKRRKKKTERKKERNQLWPLQHTRHQITIFVFDWLIIVLVFQAITDQGHGKA